MARNDFNGDGRSDIIWLLGGTATVSNWLGKTNGGFAVNDGNAFTHLNAMHLFLYKATGDFNGDGRTDVAWSLDSLNPNQSHTIWLSSTVGGWSLTGPSLNFEVDPSWGIIGSGDFNGDGVDDLLWRHQDGRLSNWLGSKSGTFLVNDAAAMTQVSNDWNVIGTGDFNGDGRTDLLWASNSGMISNWLAREDGGYIVNDSNALANWGDPTRFQIGDFNGDGTDDLLWHNPTGELHVMLMGDGTIIPEWMMHFVTTVPTNWQIVATGDYNGDGTDDLLWRNDNGTLSNWLGIEGSGVVFTINDANARVTVPNEWAVAQDYLLL